MRPWLALLLVGCAADSDGKKVDDSGTPAGTSPTGTTGTATGTATATATGTGTGTGTGSGVTTAGPIDPTVGGPCIGVTQAGTYIGPTQIRCIEVACTNEAWTWRLVTDGWTRGARMTIEGIGSEEHDIAAIAYDEDRWWDELERELFATNYVHSVSTGADCNNDGPATMTVALEIWDYDTDTLADCAVFGADTAQFTGQPAFAGCDVWTW